MKAALVYPHQLHAIPEYFQDCTRIYLIEDPLFFTQYTFHKQKLMLHRATMKRYESELLGENLQVRYVDFHELSSSEAIAKLVSDEGVSSVVFTSVTDDWLEQRITRGLARAGIPCHQLPSPLFLTPDDKALSYRPKRESFYFFTDFYVWQRRRMEILINGGKPLGGKWSFDSENRAKLPKGLAVPDSTYCEVSEFAKEAKCYVDRHFSKNFGNASPLKYPDSREQSLRQLDRFLTSRFSQFGLYEDAISCDHTVLFHSVLTPTLNIGLISPDEVVRRSLAQENIPINSLEGFLRQVIGWREFVRMVYLQQGRRQRTHNGLSNQALLPKAFYTAETGIPPVDTVIRRVLNEGYCHHIERLMVLGNFMLLCDIDPNECYRWFMELFIDAYDWVMVPNIYGMSQFADGGLMVTKPYVSGSSYILRMSDFTKGPWCEIWDGLYWRFVDRHYDLFRSNPRIGVMASMRDKLKTSGKLERHIKVANSYLEQLFR